MADNSSFRDRVYRLSRQIPQGKVATYGQLAALAGRPGAARAVGYLMKTNPDAPHTPCHRVVGYDGSLVGYSANRGLAAKKARLIAEGVRFTGSKVDLAHSLLKTAIFYRSFLGSTKPPAPTPPGCP